MTIDMADTETNLTRVTVWLPVSLASLAIRVDATGDRDNRSSDKNINGNTKL